MDPRTRHVGVLHSRHLHVFGFRAVLRNERRSAMLNTQQARQGADRLALGCYKTMGPFVIMRPYLIILGRLSASVSGPIPRTGVDEKS
jgi:hypothetical protein